MFQKQWTLLLIPEGETSVKQIRLSREVVRATIAAGLLLVSLMGTLLMGVLVRDRLSPPDERLMRKNALLTAELASIRQRLREMELSLADLSEQDRKFRVLAGLQPIDDDVLQAGTGGPGGGSLAADPLFRIDPEVGTAAYETSYDVNRLLSRARVLTVSMGEATDSLARKTERLRATPSILPVSGYISSAYSQKRWHPILQFPRPHEGLDIAAPTGTPILAAADGRVSFTGRKGDYGNTVEIDHGYGLVTRYAHASRILVSRGQRVKRGDKIAEVGKTGLAINPHLHYEVLEHGKPRNPSNFLFDRGVILD